MENIANPKPGFGLYCFEINKKSNLFVKLLIKCIYLGSLFASICTYSYIVFKNIIYSLIVYCLKCVTDVFLKNILSRGVEEAKKVLEFSILN